MCRKVITISALLIFLLVIVGCGAQSSSPSPKPTAVQKEVHSKENVINPTDNQKYGGVDNYAKYKNIAAQNPEDENAQITAGMSAYSNNDYQMAINYYKEAIKINPNNGIAYNNIGNTYFRGLKDPKTALQFYTKATQVQPSYGYGWLNLALCQKALGDISGAKTTVAGGLNVLSSSDQLYKALTQLKSQLK